MALYFCTGVLEDETLFRHYALNVPFYTHFTSPIRRYADIIVHRLLSASLGGCCLAACRAALGAVRGGGGCAWHRQNSWVPALPATGAGCLESASHRTAPWHVGALKITGTQR